MTAKLGAVAASKLDVPIITAKCYQHPTAIEPTATRWWPTVPPGRP